MAFAQADSITSGIGFPTAARFPGYPNGWVTRVLNGGGGTVWYSDPSEWVDSLGWTSGIVDAALLETPKASVSMSHLSFNPTTGMVTVDLTGRFVQAMSGDLRFNVLITEDSVSGPAGSTYDQHNYYKGNTSYPQSPFYNQGTGAYPNGVIAGFQHMHVYRGSMAGIFGAKGIIPSSVTPGQEFSTTFSFRLPYSVQNPNHVKVIGIVNQYSATDASKNEVFDAVEQPLSATPIKVVTADYTLSPQAGFNQQTNETFVTAHATGDSTVLVSVFNAADKDVRFSLTFDQSKLPAGWTYSIDSTMLTVPAFSNAIATVKIHAPSQSNFVVSTLQVTPVQDGYWGRTDLYPIYSLSDNTRSVIMWYSYPEIAALNGMPVERQANTAVVPLSDDIISNYPIADMDLAVIGTPLIDNDNHYFNFSNPLPTILSMLENGKKVFLTTDLGLLYGLDPNYAAGQSEEGTAFFQDSLGLTYRSTLQRVANNTYTTFKVSATNDPISKGLTTSANANGTIQYEQYTSSFDVDDTKSTKLFYFDNTAANNAGIRYENSAGGRLVFLAFKLNSLANQTNAQKIATNAITWLFSEGQGSVVENMDKEGMFATVNPFVGQTEIRYTPKADEANVTFSAYDVLGNEVAKMPSKLTNGAFTSTFDASNLAAGTYTIVAHTATGAHQVRVVAK